MVNEVAPVLSSLRKHPVPAILIVLEIALACLVFCNALFMISSRVSDIRLPNAMDEEGITVVTLEGDDPKLTGPDVTRNLIALRDIPGVKEVAVVLTMPLSNTYYGWRFGTTPEATLKSKSVSEVPINFVGTDADKALGLRLLEGRFFTAEEYADSNVATSPMPSAHVAVISRSLAQQMWPRQSALGKSLYSQPYAYRIVGIVDDVLSPSLVEARPYNSVFLPLNPTHILNKYVIRGSPLDRERILQEAQAKLVALNPETVIRGQSFAEMRKQYFTSTANMAWMLGLVCLVMLAVTAFGIGGLSSFWVQQRRQQIGVRRAIGATRADILWFFQTENFLLSTAGIIIGVLLTFLVNELLMQYYEIARLPWYFALFGAFAFWILGQLAALGPTLRATMIPPKFAMQSS